MYKDNFEIMIYSMKQIFIKKTVITNNYIVYKSNSPMISIEGMNQFFPNRKIVHCFIPMTVAGPEVDGDRISELRH